MPFGLAESYVWLFVLLFAATVAAIAVAAALRRHGFRLRAQMGALLPEASAEEAHYRAERERRLANRLQLLTAMADEVARKHQEGFEMYFDGLRADLFNVIHNQVQPYLSGVQSGWQAVTEGLKALGQQVGTLADAVTSDRAVIRALADALDRNRAVVAELAEVVDRDRAVVANLADAVGGLRDTVGAALGRPAASSPSTEWPAWAKRKFGRFQSEDRNRLLARAGIRPPEARALARNLKRAAREDAPGGPIYDWSYPNLLRNLRLPSNGLSTLPRTAAEVAIYLWASPNPNAPVLTFCERYEGDPGVKVVTTPLSEDALAKALV